MEKDKIAIIESVVKDFFETQGIKSEVSGSTTLLGPDSQIDSMGLVTIVVDIESKLLEQGIEISLLSEQAMSLRNSPFRTIDTLAGFINDTVSK